MKLRPLGNNILFAFLDDHSAVNFIPRTKSGIIQLTDKNYDEAKTPKWAVVLAAGPDVCQEILDHKYILVSPMRYTPGFDFEGTRVWKTAEPEVMAVTNDEEATYQY